MKKLYRFSLSFLLALALIISYGSIVSRAQEEYVLANPIKAFFTAKDALDQVDVRATYQPGTYYIYNKSNGMLNISLKEGSAGGWINPYGSLGLERYNDQDYMNVGLIQSEDRIFDVKIKTLGYMSAGQAKLSGPEGILVEQGVYHIYSIYADMLNITKEQGKPGYWINPNSQEEVKPIIPQTRNK